ncbi:MAG: hypothetical protein QM784_11485 [Polyangiaceae bacterium]
MPGPRAAPAVPESSQSSTSMTSGGATVGCSTEISPCVSRCFDAQFSGSPGTCVDGYQHCPDGYVPRASCPSQSCAAAKTECCNRRTGEYASPGCDAGGNALPCPEGMEPTEENQCAPEGVHVEKCSELDGQPCASAAQQCHQWWTTCKCGEVNSFVWSCVTILI